MRRALVLLAIAVGAPAGDDERLAGLVRALREGDSAAAAAAHEELQRLGRAAWPRILPLLEDRDPEVRRRARRLWRAMAGDVYWWGYPMQDAEFREGLPTHVIHKATGIEMVLVPAGSFVMGTAQDGPRIAIDSPFYLSTSEVTQGQFRRGWPDGFLFFSPDRAGYPVTGMSLVGIAPWLRRTGLRLPTEAEWEYAARAGHGGTVTDAAKHRAACAPAGQGPPNAFRLRDMEYNVAEWCADRAGDGRRVVRGGSFVDPPEAQGTQVRHEVDENRRSPWIGFRVARAP